MSIFCQAKVASIHDKLDFETKPLPVINEWPHSWPDGEISYRLNTYTNHIARNDLQDRAVTVALRAWKLRVNKISFRRERNKDKSVDFDVSFKPSESFESDNIFAQAWFPGQGPISGDVEINDSWKWVTHSQLQNLGHPPLVPVLIHEFGHSLGLRHDTTTKESIMYPSFNLGQKKNKLHQNDIDRIQSRYGKRELSRRIIDYFINRRDKGFDFR